MSMIDSAIRQGIEEGMFSAFADKLEEIGDCYDEPEDRCAMRPQDGCACLYLRWQRLPWYRRMFTKEPKKPKASCVADAVIGLMVEDAISDLRIAKRKAAKANHTTSKEPTP